jgi:sugar O-acyltransferase (sialic acid O-acetyltransferase NeuD family)
MKKIAIGVYGASGYGKEVIPLVVSQSQDENKIIEYYFIDDNPSGPTLCSYEVIGLDEFLSREVDEHYAVIAIAESKIRKMLSERCISKNVKILDIVASNVVVLGDVTMEPGHILSPFVTLTSDIKIGRSFQANIYSYVAHDCVIGDYVTFAPGVKCNGNISIGDHAYIGTGAIIKQGKPGNPLVIGEGATVGAGAMVTKSVPAGMTVFGNPAIELTKENLARRR